MQEGAGEFSAEFCPFQSGWNVFYLDAKSAPTGMSVLLRQFYVGVDLRNESLEDARNDGVVGPGCSQTISNF
jgi:hypothetical protein